MPDPPFVRGLNNPRYQQEVIATMKKTMDACALDGIPSVIAFNGYRWNVAEDPNSGEISKKEGARNTIEWPQGTRSLRRGEGGHGLLGDA